MKARDYRRFRFNRELHRLTKALGLGHWTINAEWSKDPDDDRWGWAQPAEQQMHANLGFSVSLLDEPWSTQQRVIVHELLHVVHQELVEQVDVILTQLPDDVASALAASFRVREERFVDMMSRRLQPLI